MTPTRILDQRARAALRRLEWQLGRRRVESPLGGEHRSIFRGRGMEFDQVVRYGFGDDIRDVDWNVTARLGDLYRKVFVEDREVTLFVVVNDDPALQFGSGARSKREVLFDLAGFVMMLAMLNRERAGLLYRRPEGDRLFAPTRQRARVLGALGHVFGSPPPNPADPFDRRPAVPTGLPRGALLIWLGEAPSGPPPAEWIAARRHHPMIAMRVEDAWERAGPKLGQCAAYDPTAHALVWLDATPASRAAHAQWHAARERDWARWWPDRADRLVIDAEADPLTSLVRFLRARGGAR